MSYMRYPLYAWSSGECDDDCPDDCTRPDHERMHLWPSITDDERVGVLEDPESYERQGGINLRMDLFDDLVVCRFAQLLAEGRLPETVARVRDPSSPVHGNFGSWEFRELMGEDPAAEFRARAESMSKPRS